MNMKCIICDSSMKKSNGYFNGPEVLYHLCSCNMFNFVTNFEYEIFKLKIYTGLDIDIGRKIRIRRKIKGICFAVAPGTFIDTPNLKIGDDDSLTEHIINFIISERVSDVNVIERKIKDITCLY